MDAPFKLESPVRVFTFVGGYPVLYLTRNNSVLCPSCVQASVDEGAADNETPQVEDESDPGWYVVAHGINYEDDTLTCDECSGCIESAYPEDC